VAVLPTVGSDQYGIIDLIVVFTDLRQVEGTPFGGYASLDAVDCRDSERY
jgi:hypothetical protein